MSTSLAQSHQVLLTSSFLINAPNPEPAWDAGSGGYMLMLTQSFCRSTSDGNTDVNRQGGNQWIHTPRRQLNMWSAPFILLILTEIKLAGTPSYNGGCERGSGEAPTIDRCHPGIFLDLRHREWNKAQGKLLHDDSMLWRPITGKTEHEMHHVLFTPDKSIWVSAVDFTPLFPPHDDLFWRL